MEYSEMKKLGIWESFMFISIVSKVTILIYLLALFGL